MGGLASRAQGNLFEKNNGRWRPRRRQMGKWNKKMAGVGGWVGSWMLWAALVMRAGSAPQETAITPRGGLFASNVTVTITSAAAADVRFTLDGSLPTTNSTRYTGALLISNSCVL